MKHLDDIVLKDNLAGGCLPKEWKHAVMVPILKPGKEASDPSAYRPTALTAVLCKIMERIVTNRLVFLETKGLFADFRFEERMTWAVHVSKILLKCEKVLNVIKSLAGCEWGADRETMLLIFQAMMRYSLDYGCFISQMKTIINKSVFYVT